MNLDCRLLHGSHTDFWPRETRFRSNSILSRKGKKGVCFTWARVYQKSGTLPSAKKWRQTGLRAGVLLSLGSLGSVDHPHSTCRLDWYSWSITVAAVQACTQTTLFRVFPQFVGGRSRLEIPKDLCKWDFLSIENHSNSKVAHVNPNKK